MTAFFFYLFSAALLLFAGAVVAVRQPVYAVLSLVAAFFCAGALWLLLEAEFLAIVLVLLYVGAVMVLFLFVVMMLDLHVERMREGFFRIMPLGLAVSGLWVAEMAWALWKTFGGTAFEKPAAANNAQALGQALFTDYLVPLEVAGLILLVAMVAAIALTLRRRPGVKRQDPGEQVRARAKDRVRLEATPRA